MLFSGATLVLLPSILREHSNALPKRKDSAHTTQHWSPNARPDQVKLMVAAAISPLKMAWFRAKKMVAQASSEGNFHFSGVNLQHKDSKKVLFPYETGVFSSSIRIAIGE